MVSNLLYDLQSNSELLDSDCKTFLDDLFDTDLKILNAKILRCLFWKLSEAIITIAPEDVSEVGFTRDLNMSSFF